MDGSAHLSTQRYAGLTTQDAHVQHNYPPQAATSQVLQFPADRGFMGCAQPPSGSSPLADLTDIAPRSRATNPNIFATADWSPPRPDNVRPRYSPSCRKHGEAPALSRQVLHCGAEASSARRGEQPLRCWNQAPFMGLFTPCGPWFRTSVQKPPRRGDPRPPPHLPRHPAPPYRPWPCDRPHPLARPRLLPPYVGRPAADSAAAPRRRNRRSHRPEARSSNRV